MDVGEAITCGLTIGREPRTQELVSVCIVDFVVIWLKLLFLSQIKALPKQVCLQS